MRCAVSHKSTVANTARVTIAEIISPVKKKEKKNGNENEPFYDKHAFHSKT